TLAPSGGIVVITTATALGTGASVSGAPNSGITTANSNSQLQINNVSGAINERLKLNGTGIANDGALLETGPVGSSTTWAGAIELDSDAAIGASGGTSLNITSVINDLGAGHNLTINPTANNAVDTG